MDYFFKLYQLGLRGKGWGVLKLLFKDFVCKIKIAVKVSSEFLVLKGLHQGQPISMDVYCMYDNALLNGLHQSIIGIDVPDNRINCVPFADDVTLVAASKND